MQLTDDQIIKIKDACVEQILSSDSWDTDTARKIGKQLLGNEALEEIIGPQPKTEYQIINEAMQIKMDEMYEDNKISKSDMDDIRMFNNRIFSKCYNAKPRDHKSFEDFQIYEIQRDPGFTEVDKEELDMNGYALEVLEYLFNLEVK